MTEAETVNESPAIFLRLFESVKTRVRLARSGIFYLDGRALDIRSVNIAGKRVEINLPEAERATQVWELVRLLFLDCYQLSSVRPPVRTVLDIGANLGFFALAARQAFPNARIHCYEPNQDVEPALSKHCSAVNAEYFVAGVGASAGRISLHRQVNSLHSVSRVTPTGSIRQVAFAEAVERLGTVDVLKLDCEGAEWDIFSNPLPWASVRHVTMEYHLWAKPASSVDDLGRQLKELGFSEVFVKPDSIGNWGLAWARRPDLK